MAIRAFVRRIIVFVPGVLLLLPLLSTPACGQSVTLPSVLFDTIPGNAYVPGGYAINHGYQYLYDQSVGVGFEPGRTGKLTTLTLAAGIFGGPNALGIELCASDRNGNPGVTLESWRLDGALRQVGMVSVDSTAHPLLNAGERYWVELTAPVATTNATWFYPKNPGIAPVSFSGDNGQTWLPAQPGYQAAFRVQGTNVTISDVPEPSVLMFLAASGTAGLLLRRRSSSQKR